jgi:hypothetical protein
MRMLGDALAASPLPRGAVAGTRHPGALTSTLDSERR